MCMESSFYHYGTHGMKWGVRRYQNKNGSLTPERKKRYGYSDLSRKSDSELRETVKRKNLEKAYRKATKSDDDGVENAKKLADASKTAADSAKDLERKIPSRKRDSLDLKNMTDKEMRDAIALSLPNMDML